MSGIVRLGISSSRLLNSSLRSWQIVPSRACGWVHEWKPGPYPKTKEERERAAKKYNMIPEDYEPYPEGSGYGDYPKLPMVSMDARNPYENFDYYYRRRNFGEPLHIDYDILMAEKSNPNYKPRFTYLQMVATFLSLVAVFIGLKAIDMYYDLRTAPPTKPKQYPIARLSGEKHYTFEPVE